MGLRFGVLGITLLGWWPWVPVGWVMKIKSFLLESTGVGACSECSDTGSYLLEGRDGSVKIFMPGQPLSDTTSYIAAICICGPECDGGHAPQMKAVLMPSSAYCNGYAFDSVCRCDVGGE